VLHTANCGVREIAAATKLCVLDVVVEEGGEIKGGLGKSIRKRSIDISARRGVQQGCG